MAMFRAMSTRRSHGAYDKIHSESDVTSLMEAQYLKRARSVPAGGIVSVKLGSAELAAPKREPETKKAAKKGGGKSHPLLGWFYGRRRQRKTTATPEFARYLEYVKEGGMWDARSNVPVMHYK